MCDQGCASVDSVRLPTQSVHVLGANQRDLSVRFSIVRLLPAQTSEGR
jgi:hypothetical protein